MSLELLVLSLQSEILKLKSENLELVKKHQALQSAYQAQSQLVNQPQFESQMWKSKYPAVSDWDLQKG